MAAGQLSKFIGHLRTVLVKQDGAGLPDGDLVKLYVRQRDEAAFEALVRRHGPMVMGVCRRVLHNSHDAEDAFQATFLVLVRKAATLRSPGLVANWLYGVAHRTALEARKIGTKRRAKEAMVVPQTEMPADPWADLRAELDQELERLPEKYRSVIVLCDLEGKTRREAARHLRCPEGTVASRLASARRRLAKQLSRHGLAVSGGALAALLSQNASACVPTSVVSSTIKAAYLFGAGKAAATGVISVKVSALTQEMLKTMLLTRIKLTGGFLVAVMIPLGMTVYLAQGIAQGVRLSHRPSVGLKPEQARADQDKPKPGNILIQLDLALSSTGPDGNKVDPLPPLGNEDVDGFQVHTARFSPDNKRMAFGKAVKKEGNGTAAFFPPDKIYVRNATKSTAAEVLVAMPDVQLLNWAWSPDGKRLAFHSFDSEHNSRNWVVDVHTKKVEEIKFPRYKFKDKEYTTALEAWSPDRQWFLASGDGLHLVKFDGSASRRLCTVENLMHDSCRFSPNGQKVLFVTVNKNSSMSLSVADVGTGKSKPVVQFMNFGDMHACWSPDGKQIAYCVTLLDNMGQHTGETSLFVTDLEGKNNSEVMTRKGRPLEVTLRLLDWR